MTVKFNAIIIARAPSTARTFIAQAASGARSFIARAPSRARTRTRLSAPVRRIGGLHESPDIGDVPGESVIGERLDENSTILHALDAVIEDREDSAVGAGADQAAKTLFQRQHSLRHLVFGKGVPGRPSVSARTRAATTGSEGTANGSRSTMTQESWSPGTSTPCQKLEVANRTAPLGCCEISRAAPMRGAVPCRKQRDSLNRARQTRS